MLIGIPLASIAVPAILTWARDLDATARRVRRLDEQSKIVAFWENWLKIVSSTSPTAENYDLKTEKIIEVTTYHARFALAEAGKAAVLIYRIDEFRPHWEFKLDYAGFQRYRASLPWYRRAFLLYKAPNPSAQLAKVRFYAILAGSFITVPINLFLDRNHITPAVPPISPEHLKYLHSHWGIGLSFLVLMALVLSALIVFWVGMILWTRRRVIRFENDRRYYLRDQFNSR